MARRKNVHDTIFKTFLVIFVAGEALIVFRPFVFSFEPIYPNPDFSPVVKGAVELHAVPGEMWARYRNREYGFTLDYPVFGNWRVVGESETNGGTYISLGNWLGTFGAEKGEHIVVLVRGNEAKTSFKDWFMREVDPKGALSGQGSVIVADLKNNWKLRYVSKPFPKTYLSEQNERGVPVCRYYLSPPSANYFVTLCPGVSTDLATHGLDGTFDQKFMMEIANSLSESS